MTRDDYDVGATSALLREVFPNPDVCDPAYLHWLYNENPDGGVVAADLDDAAGRVGHYAVVPWPCAAGGAELRTTLSLNTAVAERGRGAGLFTRLARDAYQTAVNRGFEAVVGVANANSTPGFVKRLEFSLIGPLPVRVLLPTGYRSGRITPGMPEPARLADILAAAAAAPGITRSWSPESLRWRLARPGGNYVVHDGGEWLAVTTVDRSHRVPIAIILAVIAARPLARGEAASLVRRACRVHRTPSALHAGHNTRLQLRSLPLPARLRPSPLNLIYRRLDAPSPPPAFDRFEFLDFDAY